MAGLSGRAALARQQALQIAVVEKPAAKQPPPPPPRKPPPLKVARALKEGFEGDVKLRILIDADGSVAKVDILLDPGEGLGEAAARMVKAEYRFAPATVNGTPVATTVPFTVHFTLN